MPYRAWPRDSMAPVLMGQRLEHEDHMKIWYHHVWAWKANPNGLFATFTRRAPPGMRREGLHAIRGARN